MYKALTVIALCMVWCSTTLVADEVYLVNGDRISGKITSLADGKMTVESDLSGKLTVDLNSISTFSTKEPVTILLKEGTTFKKPISKSENGRFMVAGDQTLANQDFKVASIAAINQPPKELPKWHGIIFGALTSTHGNTSLLSESFSANLSRRSEIDRTLLSTDYFYTKQKNPNTGDKEVTQDQWKARGEYDYFFSKKFFGFIDTRYERDRIANIERRVLVGGGVGYQWVESVPFNFSTQAGFASRYEVVKNQDTGELTSDSQLSVLLGYHLDKQLNKTFTVLHDLTYYPSMEDGSDYFLTTSGELRAKLTDLIFANFKAILDFDSTPAPGKGKTDVKYILGIGVTF